MGIVKPITLPDYPLALVEWFDSYGSMRWESEYDVKKTVNLVISVGWIFEKNDKIIRMVPHISWDDDGSIDQILGHLAIPRAAVTRIKIIKV